MGCIILRVAATIPNLNIMYLVLVINYNKEIMTDQVIIMQTVLFQGPIYLILLHSTCISTCLNKVFRELKVGMTYINMILLNYR